MSERLTPTDWLDFGLTMLAEHGHGALKADVLATAKGVSRGSFYWHFKNLKDFHARLLGHWRESTTRRVIVDIDALEDGQLAALMRRAFMNPPALERAIRAWSVGDEEASRVVASVDAERLAYIEALLANAGTPVEHLSARASFIYWAYLGRMVSSTVPPDEGEVSALASLLIQPQPGEP